MKLKSVLTISLLALGLPAARAQEVKPTLPAAPAAPMAKFTDAQLIEEFGWFIGKRAGLSELGFAGADLESFIKGLRIAADGKEAPIDLEKCGPALDEFMRKKQDVYTTKMKQQATAATTAYFAKLKENKNVVELPSGLRYEVVAPGTGAFPTAADTVKVNYKGTLVDGTVFDASEKHQPPGP
ncbi:MAG: hypothetical protein RLZZ15_1993, partial [Verrucomicrobiota bacterium]